MPNTLEKKAREFLPLSEATFFILISLATPLHGYGVIQAVKEKSAGKVVLGPGTLYGAFNRLLQQKLIARIDEPDEGDERRKLYILTALGRELVRQETLRLLEMGRLGKEALQEMGGGHDALD